MLEYVGIVFLTYIAMEGITWLTHKYVMHGFMWYFHSDHHDPRKKPHRFFEKNDVFFLLFAIPAIAMFFIGATSNHLRILTAIASGITLYGLTYFLIHDVLIHRRFKFMDRFRNIPYLRGLILAHRAHHKHIGKEDGECFGLLIVPLKFFKMD